MNLNVTGIIEGIVQISGVIAIAVIIRGLITHIKGLNKTIDIQNDTLKAMNDRILETEKIVDLYKQFAHDYPKVIEDFKNTTLKNNNEIIESLQGKIDRMEYNEARNKKRMEVTLNKLTEITEAIKAEKLGYPKKKIEKIKPEDYEL